MAYEMVMPYHLHMPSYFLETFTEYPARRTLHFIQSDQTTIRYYIYYTISFPKGVSAKPASLKCCSPNGMPMTVMQSNTPNAR